MKLGSPRFSRAIIGTLLLGVVLIAVFALPVETSKEKEAKELNVKAAGKIESEEKAGEAAKSHETTNQKESVKWIDSFPEDKADLVSTGKNPYFILEPGYTLALEDKDNNKLTITVLSETKNVDGVETRIVEERETEDGKVVEVSRNFFAISKRTNNVYYFGEDSREFKNDQLVSQGGSWEAGVNGARFGLMMPGAVVVGSGYYQEVAPKVAMDRAQCVSTSETVKVPAGTFQSCLKTEETSPIEPRSKEYKYYAPGVGLLKDGDFKLVRYGSSNAAPKP